MNILNPKKSKNNNSGNLNVGILMTLALFAVALYFIPLESKTFYFDDHFSIESNDVIKKMDLPGIFEAFNTRFLPGLSFAFNYQFCHLHPAGYRLTNILIHSLNAFLVYLLARSCLYLSFAGKQAFFCSLEWPAFFAAMLFLCHPIQTEPVNFITQRFVLMGTLFYLLTLYLYIQYSCRGLKRYLIASLTSAVAAMFCKEFVVTLPVMIALYDSYYLNIKAENWWKRCRRILPFFVIALIVPILLSRTPQETLGVASIADRDSIHHIDITRARFSIGRKQYFLTEINVVCTYVRLLFLPIDQNLDYDYPISKQLDMKTALCGLFLLCLISLGCLLYKTHRIISFSILWFFIALSVESSFIPIGDVITEYRPYLASVGFALLVMMLIYMQPRNPKRLNVIAAVILIGFSILTFQRNKIWKDELDLWNDTVMKSPHKARGYCSRGAIYNNQGKFPQAMSDDNMAIVLNPKYAMAYLNRGIVYYKQGKFIQALSDFNKAIEIDPKYAKAYFNRGDYYHNKGNLSEAIADYTKAIEINPKLAEGYNNRGNTYADGGHMSLAFADYNKAIEINSEFAYAYNGRGIIYAQKGDLTRAISDFTRAIEIDPKFAAAYYDRGFAYYYGKVYDKAWSDVRRAQILGAVVNPNFINKLKAVL